MKTTAAIKLASEGRELRIVWAEVYLPDVPDTDGDYMDAETIQKMAHDFMRNLALKNIDVMHDGNFIDGAGVVESFIARKGDPDFIEGAWVVGVHVADDETWKKIKNQELNAFSLEAITKQRPAQIEMEIPPVISGITTKNEDHEHEYFVTYGPNGEFLGGQTNVIDGHKHLIKRGTVTEEGGDPKHWHRFSYMDELVDAQRA